MSENDIGKTGKVLDEAQVTAVSGGDACSPATYIELTRSLKESYDNLVDFTSYVFERVLGK
jgi:hypothetical protein